MSKTNTKREIRCGICCKKFNTNKRGFQICDECRVESRPKRIQNYFSPLDRCFKKRRIKALQEYLQKEEFFKLKKLLIGTYMPIWVLQDSTLFHGLFHLFVY